MYRALKRITLYDSPERIKRNSLKAYGLLGAEAVEYAYENVLDEARAGLRGVRIPKRPAPANGAVCVPPSQPEGEDIADASEFEGGKL